MHILLLPLFLANETVSSGICHSYWPIHKSTHWTSIFVFVWVFKDLWMWMWNHPHIHIVDVWVFTISIWHGNPSFCSEYSASRHWIMTWDFQDDSCCLLSTIRQKQAAFQHPRNWAASDFFLPFFGPEKAVQCAAHISGFILYCAKKSTTQQQLPWWPGRGHSLWKSEVFEKKVEFHRAATPLFDYRADYFV